MFLPSICRTLTAVAAAVMVSLMPVPLLAQHMVDAPVIVAIPDQFPTTPALSGGAGPPKVSAMVRRYASPAGGRDIIILDRENATPAVLNAALVALERHRARHRIVERDGVLMIPAAIHLPRVEASRGAVLAEKLARMRDQRSSHLDRIGAARWIEISDPSQVR